MYRVASPLICTRTFREAAESYINHGGEGKYLPVILDYFGDRMLVEIFPFDIRQMALELYPTQSNATRNRQAITPVRAVFTHAYDRGWASLMRIQKLKEGRRQTKKPASVVWLHCFISQADRDHLPHLATLVMFMAQTGARVSEAVALRWSEVDLHNRQALLLKTKTERNSPRFLTDDLIGRLHALAAHQRPEDPVFRYNSRYSVNERIKAVCMRANIPYKSSHACGRHSFATNAIALGADIAVAMEAGGWKSSKVFIETYVHPRNPGRRVAELFNTQAYETGL
jgi:integrase